MAKNYDWDIDLNDDDINDWDYTPTTESPVRKLDNNKSSNTKVNNKKSLKNNSKAQTSTSTQKTVSQSEDLKSNQLKDKTQLNNSEKKPENKHHDKKETKPPIHKQVEPQKAKQNKHMKALVCEMCGSNDIIKQQGLFVCQNCGTKYTVEEAKKMMIEGTVDVKGTVKIDSSTELKNLYELARRAKTDNNSENAQKYYGQIIIKDPSSWEANFYTTYYQSMNCKIGEIGVAAVRVSNCEDTVFYLIKDNVTDPREQRKAVDEVAAHLITISNMLFNAYKKHFDEISYQIKNRYVQEYANNCSAAKDIVYNGGNWIVKIFGDTYGDIAAECWKLGVRQHNILNSVFKNKRMNAAIIKEYNMKIAKYDSSYRAPQTNMTGAGCYIATAVYGSYDCPEVWVLRRFRDNYLKKTWCGRVFVEVYYTLSPTLVKMFGNSKGFKKMWRKLLNSIIKRLEASGYDNTPYHDKIE